MNLLKRTITGIVLIALATGFMFLRKINVLFFDIFIYFAMTVGTFEFVRAVKDKLTLGQKIMCGIFSATILPCYLFLPLYFKQYVIFLALLGVADLIIEHSKATLENVSIMTFIAIYPNILLLCIAWINAFENVKLATLGLISIMFISCFSDAVAFFVGTLIKGPKLCPTISPHKTVSGAAGGLIGGLIAGLIVCFVFNAPAAFNGVSNGVVYFFMATAGAFMSVLTQIGDLVESALKRKIGIKDFGNIFPGHGGMLDRIDGMLFSSGFVYILFSFFA